MIIYTKKGSKTDIPWLFAILGSVFIFCFYESATFTDPFDGSIWNWVGVDPNLDEIIGVSASGVNLIPTVSALDCFLLASSFFWDDVNGRLFVRWPASSDDHAIDRDMSSYSSLLNGYANGYSRINQNVFDGMFYDPIIIDVGKLAKKVDPIKFGLVAFEESSYSLTDQKNSFYQQAAKDAVGDPVRFYLAEETDLALTNAMRVFTGYNNGYQHKRDAVSYKLNESRFFQNAPSCPHKITLAEYPDAGDLVDNSIPVAWGDIRRGIVVPTNNGVLTSGALGTAVILVADPSLGPVLAITAVYDKDGISQPILASDLIACTVSVTKPINISPGDIKDWTWQGQGYDIIGTYNNGLDIIKNAFQKLAGIPFIASCFELGKWAIDTAANPEAVGLSVQSDKGMIEDICQPICVSLQGVIEILGDGRISWASRDITAIPITAIRFVQAVSEIDFPKIDMDPTETVSELVLEYAPNFKDEKDKLSYNYTVDAAAVIADYNITRRDPLSPVQTVLVNQADVIALGAEIMDTSKQPIRKITTEDINVIQSRLFSIIGIDTGLFGVPNVEYGELLAIESDYNKYQQNLTIRIIPGYAPLVLGITYFGFGFTNGYTGGIDYGYSNAPHQAVDNGFGYPAN